MSDTCHIFLNETGKKESTACREWNLAKGGEKPRCGEAGTFRECREFASLVSWNAGEEEVTENESRRGGRTEVFDGIVWHEKLIEFPNKMPTSINGDI